MLFDRQNLYFCLANSTRWLTLPGLKFLSLKTSTRRLMVTAFIGLKTLTRYPSFGKVREYFWTRVEDSLSNFEKTIAELEQIVKDMEQGDLPLQAALEKFERGVQLTKQGQATLEAAEQKVQVLMNQNGQQELGDLNSSDE